MLARRFTVALLSVVVAGVMLINALSIPRERVTPIISWLPYGRCTASIVEINAPLNWQIYSNDYILLRGSDNGETMTAASRANVLLPSGGAGDLIGLLYTWPHSGASDVMRAQVVSPRSLTFRPIPRSAPDWLHRAEQVWVNPLLALAYLALGFFMLWRGRDRNAFLLALFALSTAIALMTWYSALPSLARTWFYAFQSIIAALSGLALYALTERFFAAKRRRRFIGRSVAVAAVCCSIVVPYGVVHAITSGCFTGTDAFFPLWDWKAWPALGAALAAIATLIAASGFFSLSRPQRAACLWLLIPAVALAAVTLLEPIANAMSSTIAAVFKYDVRAFVQLSAACMFAYAILARREIAAAFVIRKVFAYGLLGLVLTMITSVLEHSAIGYFEALGFSDFYLIQVGQVALIGIAFTAMHRRLDMLIEHVITSKREQAKLMLWRFLRELWFIRDPRELVSRAVKQIRAALDAESVVIYEPRDGEFQMTADSERGAYPAAVQLTDPVVTALQADISTVELRSVLESELGHDGMAIPIVLRHDMRGLVLISRRADGEPYTEDEKELLELVSRTLAVAIVFAESRPSAEARLPEPELAPS